MEDKESVRFIKQDTKESITNLGEKVKRDLIQQKTVNVLLSGLHSELCNYLNNRT